MESSDADRVADCNTASVSRNDALARLGTLHECHYDRIKFGNKFSCLI